MRTTTRRRIAFTATLLFFVVYSYAQDLRTFNQNASRSNHTRGLSVSLSPVYSTALNTGSDSLLFRGSGGGFRVGADYFFGKAGLGFNSGFGSSSPDNTAINNFLSRSPIPPDQLIITKSSQQNMYLLVGPSIQVGNKVQLYAHAKGGLFINNGGLVSIQQKGAQRVAYRNESTGKTAYPGFQTGLNFQYTVKSDVWSFGIGADYMSTKTEVMNYDARRGGGIEGLKLSQNISDIVAGISIRYNIFSPRDHASGQSTGKRVLPTVNKREIASSRDVASGQSTGKRTYQPGQPTYGNLTSEEENSGSCGPVTKKITNPDGTTEEMTFSCPDDAANYASQLKIDGAMPNRISMNVTVPKQTQGTTFGEKVNAGLHAAGGALAQGASLSIISGTLTWGSSGSAKAIVTNNTVRGGSATMNSQNSATRTTNQSSFGTLVRLSARDAGSGMATGKRSKDAGSGLATGRRQYEPFFAEGEGDVCNPCLATAKMSNIKNNPLYEDKGSSGTNPLSTNKTVGDEDCDGVAGADIYLVDPQSGSIIAKTKTEQCGDFFFANVPEGNYVIRVSAVFGGKKGYDVNLKSKTDLAGDISQGDEWMQLLINTGSDNDMMQKAGISTSRSNIRTKSISIIEADVDGDGEFESLKVLASLYDGSTRDITSYSRMSTAGSVKKVTVRGWDPEKKQAIVGSSKEYTITISDDNGVVLTKQNDNGTKEETRATAKVSHHPNVVQFVISLDDQDGVGTNNARITKSRSNIQNNRMSNSNEEDNNIWSPRSNIKMIRVAAGDVNGDGTADLIGGNNLRTEFAVLRERNKNYFETGDKPTEEQRLLGGALPGGSVISAAMRPGSPIGGLSIKGGKNPGGNLRTVQTNENGEFEFPGLEPGDYTFTIEQRIVLDDETLIAVGGGTRENINTSESNLEEVSEKRDQPILNSKNGGKTLTADQAKNSISFRWTPLVPKPQEPVTYKLRVWQLMQGQNGTQAMRSNKPIVEKTVTNTGETSVQGILTGPCKPPYLCDFIWSVQAFNKEGKSINDNQVQTFSVDANNNDGSVTKAQDHNSSRSNKTASVITNDPDESENPVTKAQNNNTVRSNRTELKAISIEADLDGDGVYESNVSNKLNDEVTIDGEGNISTTPQQKTGVSTSRSNIRTRGGLVDKGDGIFISYGTASIDNKDVAVKMIYKSSHDMQMGAIRNLK